MFASNSDITFMNLFKILLLENFEKIEFLYFNSIGFKKTHTSKAVDIERPLISNKIL